MTYACAIAPLDQTTTSLGWSPGTYARASCVVPPCGWTDDALQFLADPGTPVVAPFPLAVTSTRPFLADMSIPLPAVIPAGAQLRIDGLEPVGFARLAQVAKGDLLGRVARGARGVKLSVVGPSRVIPGSIVPLFRELGLDVVGATVPTNPQFRLTPRFGGHLLARSGGPADCAGPIRGFRGLGTGLTVPAGYVTPSASPYARFGPSAQSDVSVPEPQPGNMAISSQLAEASGLGALMLLGLAGVAWWAWRR